MCGETCSGSVDSGSLNITKYMRKVEINNLKLFRIELKHCVFKSLETLPS